MKQQSPEANLGTLQAFAGAASKIARTSLRYVPNQSPGFNADPPTCAHADQLTDSCAVHGCPACLDFDPFCLTCETGNPGVFKWWRCPDEHAQRLAAAGCTACDQHPCALCCVEVDETHCSPCVQQVMAVYEAESPPADLTCLFHGRVRPETIAICEFCEDDAEQAELDSGTPYSPSGHDGYDCGHCVVCGECQGSGTVCRDCRRCDKHPPREVTPQRDALAMVDPDAERCARSYWDRRRRVEVVFYVHRFWSLEEGRVAA